MFFQTTFILYSSLETTRQRKQEISFTVICILILQVTVFTSSGSDSPITIQFIIIRVVLCSIVVIMDVTFGYCVYYLLTMHHTIVYT